MTREQRIDALLAPARAQYARAITNHDRNVALHQLGVARANLSSLSDEALERAVQSGRTDGGTVARTDATATEHAARMDAELEAARQRGIEAKAQLSKPAEQRKDAGNTPVEHNWQARFYAAQVADAAGRDRLRREDAAAMSRADAEREVRNSMAGRSK